MRVLAKRTETRQLEVLKYIYEQVEQQELRKEYLEAFRGGMRHHIEGMKVVDQEGTDVTPEKLKQIQREKGLHNRK